MKTPQENVNLEDETDGPKPLKIILIGAAGDIGRAAYAQLSDRHELITGWA